MLPAAVPKAAVNKNDELRAGKNEIRLAQQLLVAPPSRDSMLAKNSDELDFGRFISRRANRSHDLRALCFVEYVGHAQRLPSRHCEVTPSSQFRFSAEEL